MAPEGYSQIIKLRRVYIVFDEVIILGFNRKMNKLLRSILYF